MTIKGKPKNKKEVRELTKQKNYYHAIDILDEVNSIKRIQKIGAGKYKVSGVVKTLLGNI